MGIVVVPTYGSDPATVNAANLDAKVSGLATEFNGGIDNDNIDAAAAIANSKLNLATITQNITHSGTMTHSGVVTMSAKDLTEAKGADIASATTTTIWATDGNFMHITGTTTITSFGTAEQAGDCRTVVFDGALTLTHNATSLILPTGANITTAAGDVAIVRAETTANARVVAYIRKDGTAITPTTATEANALAGSIVQSTYSSIATTTTGNTAIPYDDTIPQSGEGNEYLTHAHTPLNASNILEISCIFHFGTASTATVISALFQDSVADALRASEAIIGGAGQPYEVRLFHRMTAGTTSAITFKYRAGTSDGSQLNLNSANSNSRKFGGVLVSSISVKEIKV